MNEDQSTETVAELDRAINQAFEAVLVDGFLKLRSRSAKSRAFLLLSPPEIHPKGAIFRILKHRTLELTREYEGKLVTKDWVIGFSQAHAEDAQCISDITYANLPPDCEVLKKNDVKIVVRDKLGSTVTVWKDKTPQISLAEYDGTRTRKWERHEVGVTNWYYDSVRF